MLEAIGLDCQRGERSLFRDLSFKLEAGGLLRIEGANGSGKTTLLRALCGLIRPVAGSIRWEGQDIADLGAAYRTNTAYLGHLNGLKEDLTAVENLQWWAALTGAEAHRVAAVESLWEMNIAEVADLPVRVLSQGQKRRVALARLAYFGEMLWLLDEPFAALDNTSTTRLAQLISSQLDRGGVVVYTTHQDVHIDAPTHMSVRLDRL